MGFIRPLQLFIAFTLKITGKDVRILLNHNANKLKAK